MRIDRFAIKALALLALSNVSLFDGNDASGLVAAESETINLLDPNSNFQVGGDEEDDVIYKKGEEPKREDTFEVPATAENFKFEAEVSRMLDIVVNSLYQNKDVFLRELISNASDALDKMRFLALTKPEWMEGEGADKLQVQIEFDPEDQTLTIRDSGIGMTHDEMIENLGTVARSGTTKFMQALKDQGESASGEVSQIGQFGVGFYSAFLVADRVQVASKHPQSDKQFVWTTTNGASDFTIFPDPRGNTLVRGTEITLFLKPSCSEYADEQKIRELTKHYSEFVMHPISLRTIETNFVEVDDEDEEDAKDPEEKDEEKKDDEDDIEVKEDDDDEDKEEAEKPKKTKEVKTFEWEHINDNAAIWTRPKEEVSDDEYQAFFKVVSKQEQNNSSTWVHFNAEGNINFKSILYLPSQLPDSYKYGHVDNNDGISLYVRKVLISDEFELLPRYLGFIRGVVDSDDLPLNVNRETLQESKIIKIVRKKLVRKAIDMIRQLAKESEEKPEDKDEEKDETAEVEIDADGNVIEKDEKEDKPDTPKPENKYLEWYKQFAPSIKMGTMDDHANRSRLMKLLRFRSSKSDGEWISLEKYVEGMKDWQKDIYILAGVNLESVEKSQFLEPFKEKGVEVLYFTDAVDEYMVGHLRDFDGKKFVDITSENVKLDDEDKDLATRREKYYKNKFKPLTKWLKKLYGPSIMNIKISKRLGSAPAIASSSSYGHSANMERIMRAQAYTHGQEEHSVRAMRVLEINPRHPLVLKLLESCPSEETEGEDAPEISEDVVDSAWILHEMALLNGGFPLTDPSGHTKRMTKFLQNSLGVESLDLAEEVDPPEEPEEAPEPDDEDGMGGFNMDDIDMDFDDEGGEDIVMGGNSDGEGEMPEPLDPNDPNVEQVM